MNDSQNLPSQRVSAPHQEELEEKGELPSSYKHHLINLKHQKQYITILRLWQSFHPLICTSIVTQPSPQHIGQMDSVGIGRVASSPHA